MQGGALLVNTHTYTVTASYNTDSETAHPFSFTDGIDSMTGAELMTIHRRRDPGRNLQEERRPGQAKINMTFKFVGKLDSSNDPALITVTLVGTVPEITP